MPSKTLNNTAFSLWRIKGTILIQMFIIVAGLFTRGSSMVEHEQLLDHVGFDFEFLRDAHVWRLLTGTWVQSTPGIALSMIFVVFGGTVFLELFAGTWAMLITCVTGDWVATILTSLTLRVLSEFGDATVTSLLAIPDAGTSALAHAGYGAAVMLLPRRWLKVALPSLIVLTSMQFFLVDLAPAIVHCWAAIYGGLVGWFILRPRLERGRLSQIDNQ